MRQVLIGKTIEEAQNLVDSKEFYRRGKEIMFDVISLKSIF